VWVGKRWGDDATMRRCDGATEGAAEVAGLRSRLRSGGTGSAAGGGCGAGEGAFERLPEAEEVLEAAAFVGEGLAAVAAVHGPVEGGVRPAQRLGHGERVVKVGERGVGELRSGVEHGLGRGLDGRTLLVRDLRGPGEVVVDEAGGVAIVGFDASANLTNPCHVHLGVKHTEVEHCRRWNNVYLIRCDDARGQELDRDVVARFRTDGRNREVVGGWLAHFGEEMWGLRKLHRAGSTTVFSPLFDSFDPLLDRRKRPQRSRRQILQPETESLLGVQQFTSPDEWLDVLVGSRALRQDGIAIIPAERVVAIIEREAPVVHPRGRIERPRSVLDGDRIALGQIGGDSRYPALHRRLVRRGRFVDDPGGYADLGKADDHDMDVSFAASFAVPSEGGVSEVDLDAVHLVELVPEDPFLLTLRDRVG